MQIDKSINNIMNSIIPFTEHNHERKFGKGGAFGLLIIGSKFSKKLKIVS